MAAFRAWSAAPFAENRDTRMALTETYLEDPLATSLLRHAERLPEAQRLLAVLAGGPGYAGCPPRRLTPRSHCTAMVGEG